MAFFASETWTSADAERFPDLAVLLEETRALTPQTFLDHAEAFARFFASPFTPAFLTHAVQEIARTGRYGEGASGDEIEILQAPSFRVSLVKIRPAEAGKDSGPDEVVCHANDYVCANLGPAPIELDVFEMPPDHPFDVFDRSITPRFVRRVSQGRGEALSVAGGRQIVRMRRPAATAYQMLAVSLAVRHPIVWHFDAETLSPKYSAAAELMASRVQTAIGVLGQMAGPSALPVLTAAAAADDPFVRWSAVSAATMIDPDHGAQLLRQALQDPHPQVRSAAGRALEALFPAD